uniref:Uncharacterized protein n=1 Tax=Setaria viridis TaxID=4556 RepID=A0A4U6WCE2_SETVI|nr:hypothetical protein SEVIR_1G244750v2 [Setaria viridis]
MSSKPVLRVYGDDDPPGAPPDLADVRNRKPAIHNHESDHPYAFDAVAGYREHRPACTAPSRHGHASPRRRHPVLSKPHDDEPFDTVPDAERGSDLILENMNDQQQGKYPLHLCSYLNA